MARTFFTLQTLTPASTDIIDQALEELHAATVEDAPYDADRVLHAAYMLVNEAGENLWGGTAEAFTSTTPVGPTNGVEWEFGIEYRRDSIAVVRWIDQSELTATFPADATAEQIVQTVADLGNELHAEGLAPEQDGGPTADLDLDSQPDHGKPLLDQRKLIAVRVR